MSKVLTYDYSLLWKQWENLAPRYAIILGTLPRLKQKSLKVHVRQPFGKKTHLTEEGQEKLEWFSM